MQSKTQELLKPSVIFLGASVFALVLSLLTFNHFANWVEARLGVILDDPILRNFSTLDFTHIIFLQIYGAIIFSLITLRKQPISLARLFFSYALLVWFRITAMYLTPLDPPEGMIILRDPIVEWFGSGGRVLTKDLFFSGHTSLAFLFAYVARSLKVKFALYINATILASLLMAQKVHYSVDVFAAPFFAWMAFSVAGKIQSYFINFKQEPN